jgi:hypothetical protein
VLGSWDAARGWLTLVEFTLPVDATDYVNSLWRDDVDRYAGDVVNGCNDGPQPDGSPGLGVFYELETSSPALALAPGRVGDARAPHHAPDRRPRPAGGDRQGGARRGTRRAAVVSSAGTPRRARSAERVTR